MADESHSGALENRRTFPIAGIGASAGGLEAISQLLRSLPLDTGIGFVIVQRLAPQHDSMLADILSRATPLPVVEVTSGTAVEPDHVYVIPPNADMAISHGVLKLIPRSAAPGLHLPIDQFFASLAEDCKEQAIGIILSGSASDGMQGLKAIKAAGGVTFAQEEATAKYGSMPHHAIASGHVDLVLAAEKMAQELVRVRRHPYVAREPAADEKDAAGLSERELSDIFAALKNATGVDFASYKEPTAVRRVRRRMALHNIESTPEYILFLQQTPGEPQGLYNDLLISVTSFFRDPELFELLKREVFPHLTEDGSVRDPIRIWVPGCSTGEEAYSVALTASEYLAGIKSSAGIQIFATDISDVALEAARAGIYTSSEVAEISSERLARFFTKIAEGYQINKSIREICVFARQNLIKDPPFSKLDLICCRNLLIYLKPSLHRRLMPLFHYALQPHGFLVLGKSESATDVSDLFGQVDSKNKIYFKKPTASGTRLDFGINEPFSAIPDSRARTAPRVARDFDPQNEELQNRNTELGRANSDLTNVIDNITIPMVVLGSDLRIRRFTAAAENILSLIPADVGRPITDLRSVLDFEGLGNMVDEAIRLDKDLMTDVTDRNRRWYSLRVRPYKTSGGKIEGAVIVLIDIHELKAEAIESRKYAEAIGETVRESILVLDAELRVKAVNEAFLGEFQVSREETEGRKLNDLGDGAWNIPKLLALLREILPEKTEVRDFEVDHEFPRLGHRVMSLNGRQIKRADGRLDWILLAFEDVTERRRSRSA
ncbi:MAG: chemotaxis protein CheB [Candidatus Acidiferrales bacterium]